MMTVFRCWLARFKNTPAGHLILFLSLCIDDYGNEASLVTLTYTLFALVRVHACALFYTPLLHGRSSYIRGEAVL